MDNNTSLNSKTGGTPIVCDLPLSILAFTDMLTLTRGYGHILSEPPEQNRWLVVRRGEPLPPQTFYEVLSRLSRGEGPLTVLRESEASHNPTPWSTLDHKASVSNRSTALAVIIGFWAVIIFLGWVGVAVLAPREHAALLQKVYFIAALGLVGWLSLPAKTGVRGEPV